MRPNQYSNHDDAERLCLKCQKQFWSTNLANRICDKCAAKNREAWVINGSHVLPVRRFDRIEKGVY